MLDFYAQSEPGRLESIEGIDTLRFIDYGKQLFCIKAENCSSLSVDTPMDLEKVRQIMKNRLSSQG
jgi:3-deoxy-manno-octulosonate cytidylyltransferase (CMP-KDO synthetase)